MPTARGVTDRDHTPVTLMIPNRLYREWKAAALDSGHTIDSYLINTIAIAAKMKLLEGTQRLPRGGAAIDPILAEAIRLNSRGKTWEHQADLLLATPAFNITAPLPPQPAGDTPEIVRTRISQQLMAKYKLPVRHPTQKSPFSIIGGQKFTWYQTVLIFAIWEHADGGWTGRRLTDHASAAGLPHRTMEPTMRQLVERGYIMRRPHAGYVPYGKHRTAKNQHKLHPAIATAIRERDIEPVA